ncbi:MAG: hypothetical protein LRY35_02915, partial [Clostridiales bacterium]|nr:hypothetical protein [Clostridiales bacterium]
QLQIALRRSPWRRRPCAAKNGKALAVLIEQTTGIPVRIITGDEEAYFDFLASGIPWAWMTP